FWTRRSAMETPFRWIRKGTAKQKSLLVQPCVKKFLRAQPIGVRTTTTQRSPLSPPTTIRESPQPPRPPSGRRWRNFGSSTLRRLHKSRASSSWNPRRAMTIQTAQWTTAALPAMPLPPFRPT
ncbi:MAG: hypothetical protein ACK559_04815, partial [bacterium]